MARSAYQWGLLHRVWADDLNNRQRYDLCHPGVGQKGYYESGCERGDHLWLSLMRTILSPEANEARRRAVEKILTRRIERDALRCDAEAVAEWGKKWISGEDRTAASCSRALLAGSSRYTALLWKSHRDCEVLSPFAFVAHEASRTASSAGWFAKLPLWEFANEFAITGWIDLRQDVLGEELTLSAADIRSEIHEWPGDE